MSDFEDRLRAGLHAIAREVEPPPTLGATVAARVRTAPAGRPAAPARRRRFLSVAAAVALAILTLGSAAAVLLARSGDEPSVGRPPADTAPPVTGPGAWFPLPHKDGLARMGVEAAWTGSELVVWGGLTGRVERGDDGEVFHGDELVAPIDGARYEAYGDLWRAMEAAPIAGRTDHVMVWTGREVVVYGGVTLRPFSGGGSTRAPVSDGAAYDPVADRWRLVAAAPPGAPAQGEGVWTGSEVVVVGAAGTGAAYDPAADRWRLLPSAPVAPTEAMPAELAVWTGREVLALVGGNLMGYDPAADRWRDAADPGGALSDSGRAVWTGKDLVVVLDGPVEAAAYDPAADAWRDVADPPLPLHVPNLAWAGDRVLAWAGGRAGEGLVSDTFSYDPAADRWTPLPPSPLEGPPGVVVWVGDRLLVWRDMFGQGARYLPDA